MALLMKIFGLTSILFILPKIPASIGYTSVSCPIITNVRSNCGSRIENICLSDSECSEEDKCCPRAADGGCSLMCVKPRALEGCPVPVDFALIVDTSGSISRRNFKRLLEFIESMLDGFDISEDGTHVAVVEYSTKPSVQMRFDDFSGAMLNAANLKRKVRRIPHSRGFTYIDKALHLANTDVFSAIGGMRPNVTKIALVMTDGKQTLDDERALTTDILLEAVQPLKDKGVRVISLGIGSGTLLLDLLTLASTDNDVYLAADFLELKGLVKDLTASKCPVDGDWSEWSEWSECPVTCGGGQQKRFRECDNPYPAFGGKPCPGNSEESRLCNTLPCAVDGNWTAWRDWEVCSVSCGGGTQNRVRTCTNPLPAHGGKDCVGEGVITRRCNEDPCPVDGNWTAWGDWGQCSVTCAGGTQSRSRTCTNPPPQYGGQECDGESKDIRPCNEHPCPIDGKWTKWRAWEPCSVTCGGGTQMSRRSCTNPAPAFGGADCEGDSVRSRSCNENGCPVDGNWTAWGDWDLCSVTCAGGTQSRSRTCTNPPPQYGGQECTGKSKDVRSCNEVSCPIDGKWTKWEAWEPCSVSCGGGTQMSRRSCTDPVPAFGGADCEGDSVRSRSCNERGCPVDGNWTDWGDWDQCSVTCAGGTQSRSRTCTNPPPRNGGRECSGESKDVRSCNKDPCPIDGRWNEWKAWEPCSVTCGGGTQKSRRSCTDPAPAHGGADCEGVSVRSRSCNEKGCPVDGKWTDWGDWDLCSVTCAGGTQSRSRTCTNPPPRNGGRDCSGESKDVRSCNELPCPIDGKWGEWRAWEPCSVSCGGGTQMSRRTCTDPAPAHGGADCEGVSVRSRSCNEKGCPVDGKWTDWGDWDLCSVTCAGGTQSRSRTCTNPPPRNGGRDCSGESEDVRSCNELPCPIDANWSEWSKFSPCTLSCGGGTHTRTRTCTNPPPKFDGQDCVGESEDVQQCNTLPCPVDGKWTVWGKWSICPVTCGGGVQDRSRTCTDPKPAFGGAPCVGASKETRSCSERPCPGDGSWSAWKAWSPCTVTCAGGRQSRSRSCTNPPPTHGGKDCLGKSDETRSCNQIPCPVDGRWTRWSDWGACPVKCGGGTQARSRSCANPPPAFGGAKCVGERRQVQACNEHPCEIDGNWARWRSWSICTKTCGGGTQDRTRTCTNPPPAHGGRDCPGKNKEARSCNNLPCPVDGKWAAWKAWGRCSRSCGGGTQVRSRTCSNPPPAYRGSSCPGRSSETQSCNEDIPCPVNGGWSYWSGWGRCSVTCGSGILYRYRTCTNPPPTHGGSQCVGHDRESYYCDRKACPVDGAWAQWGRWSRCSATCSGGIRRRERDCTNPRPSNGGKDCPGDRMEEVKCNTKQCAVNGKWGRWTRWSACSKTCGYGKRMRFRECNNPPPANGGRDCYGSKVAMVYCNTHLPCQVTCNVPLDFAILVDTSGSISRRNFKLLLRFIRSIVDGFEVSEDHTHIAIIEYSTKATVQLKFNDLPGSSLNKQNVRSRVRAIPHQRGFTYIDKALLLANEQVFTLEAGMRPDVRQVALVMTDGEQTLDESSEKTVNEILAEAAQTLKDKNVHIISLGIGQRVNKSSLETIATGDNVYYAKTFSALRQLVRKLRKGSCIVTAAGRQYKYIYQD
ncbi:SCO-spondin-like isoform X3 [Oculina patagonica]